MRVKVINTKQNRKASPNENFARELMELFTLGRDNTYTETDIKEAARAFTGWSHKRNGAFFLRMRQHDFGEKTFFGIFLQLSGHASGKRKTERAFGLKITLGEAFLR